MKRLGKFWDTHFLGVQFVLVLFITGAFILWSERYDKGTSLDVVLKGNRSAIYSALASITGALFGFIIAALTILLGYSTSDRLALIRKSKHYPKLWATFTSAIRALAATILLSLLGLIFDRESAPSHWIFYLTLGGTLLSAARLERCLWILESIVQIVTRHENKSSQDKTPETPSVPPPDSTVPEQPATPRKNKAR